MIVALGSGECLISCTLYYTPDSDQPKHRTAMLMPSVRLYAMCSIYKTGVLFEGHVMIGHEYDIGICESDIDYHQLSSFFRWSATETQPDRPKKVRPSTLQLGYRYTCVWMTSPMDVRLYIPICR